MAQKQAGTADFDSEAYLAALWKEIIGVGEVQPTDRFLDLGGNSLTLNVVLKRVEKETGATMRPRLFFQPETSSLSDLARTLDALLANAKGLSLAEN